MNRVDKPFAAGLLGAAMSMALLVAPVAAQAAEFKVLYSFKGAGDGGDPAGAPVLDRHGNLFGLTNQGGPGGDAVLFALHPRGGGGWREAVLHQFPPQSSGVLVFPSLTIDGAGSLFGTDTTYPTGAGEVFTLAPPTVPDGSWSYRVLARFAGSSSPLGDFLAGGLLIGRGGEIFGVASAGGDESGRIPCDCGLVYSLSPSRGSGEWAESVLSVFHAVPDGDTPYAGLTFGPGGALYGTTQLGGTGKCRDGSGVVVVGCGALYSLAGGGATWSRSTLHSFRPADPSQPTDALTLGQDGALYGFSTLVAYRFAPPHVPGGRWFPSVIHAFPGGIAGASPVGAPVFDAKGDIYGLTRSFGFDGPVTLFELTPPKSGRDGPWRAIELHRFAAANFEDQPAGGLAIGADGTLYGAIGGNSSGSNGYVFSYRP